MMLSTSAFSKKFRTGLVIAGALCIAAVPGWAAGGEISVSGGGTTLDGGVGTHGLIGANAAFRLGDKAHLFGEFSWSPLASATVQASSGGVNATATGNVNLASFGGGFDYGFGSSERVIPYLVTAAGVGHFYATGSASATNGNTANVSLSLANDAYFAAGAGVRLYVGKSWGFKPEVRYQRYQGSTLSANSVIYTVGLFWQFGQ